MSPPQDAPSERRTPDPHPAVAFVCLSALLFGSPLAGAALTQRWADRSEAALWVGFLVLPAALVATLAVWLVWALAASAAGALWGAARTRTLRGALHGLPRDIPGLFLLWLVPLGICPLVGLVHALVSDLPLASTTGAFLLLGAGYGVVLRVLGGKGILFELFNAWG